MIDAYKARQRLAVFWTSILGTIILLLLYNTLTGGLCDNFETNCEKSNILWDWLLSNTLPTLSVIISAVVFDATKNNKHKKYVERFYFYFSLVASAFYLSLIALPLVISILTPTTSGTFEFLNNSIITTVGQIMTAGTIGIFFTQDHPHHENE